MDKSNSSVNSGPGDAFNVAGFYGDAIGLYQRELQAGDLFPARRMEAALKLGASLMFQGRLSEALAHFGEVYAESSSEPHLRIYACRAQRYQVNVLQRLHDSAPAEEADANTAQQMRLIRDGLRWLHDTGNEAWRSGLLYHLAQLQVGRGEYELALDSAEEAYRWSRAGERCSYCIGDHIDLVARCARHAGRFVRGLEVLDELLRFDVGPLGDLRGATERARLYRSMTPPRLVEAMEAARIAVRVATQVQAPREQLFAYGEHALCALRVESFEEARAALHRVYLTACDDATEDHLFLLRVATNLLDEAKALLSDVTDCDATGLYEAVTAWSNKVAGRLDSS